MSTNTDFDKAFGEVLEETCELLASVAKTNRGRIMVSEETAALLDSIGSAADASASSAAPASSGDNPEIESLRAAVSSCTKCELSETRTQVVFGDGNLAADIVFVGEAPGEEEDRQGLPFVGRSGQLLTDIIEKGMEIPRSDVYICNVLKCRPPGNRDPKPAERDLCEPYLVRQLELIQPKVICALGGHAAKTLLKTDEATGRLRGKWHFYHGIPLRVTYHPSYLLRSPGEKKKTWADVQEILKVLSGGGQAVEEASSITV